MRKLVLSLAFFFLFFAASAQPAQAQRCGDTIGQQGSYCALGCGNGDTQVSFPGCNGLDVCCQQRDPAAARCGDQVGGKPTYCGAGCGGGDSQTNLPGCNGLDVCCQSTKNDCTGCMYGRQLYCSRSGGANAEAPGHSCYGGATCFLGAFSAECPAEKPPTGNVCNINATTDGKQTFCSPICGGGSKVAGGGTWTGCDVGSFCCASDTTPGTQEEWQAVEAFEFCKQAPAGPQRAACEACVAGNPGEKIYTAVGCIRVSGIGLTEDLVGLLLGISGGIALLTILGGAFLLSTSQGEAGKVKTAKEMITAAVTGILFIIFSVVILDFIGVKILVIPGLN